MSERVVVQVSLNPDELAALDRLRGDSKRSTWLKALLSEAAGSCDSVALRETISGSRPSTAEPRELAAVPDAPRRGRIVDGKRANGHNDRCKCLSCELLLGKVA